MTWFEERLESGGRLILDGAIGTELERRGVPMDGNAWCARATMSAPDTVRNLHVDYIDAGADVITANTFANHRYVLEPAGLAGQLEPLSRRAVALAVEARDAAASDRPVAIAGSLSHMSALQPGFGWPDLAEASAHYRELAAMLADAGCDLLVAEMMMYQGYAEAVIEAAHATGLPVWVGFSISVKDGEVVTRYHPTELGAGDLRRSRGDRALADLAPGVLNQGGTVAGVMHSDVEITAAGLSALKTVWGGPLMAYAHSGGWTPPNWVFENVMAPAVYAEAAAAWVENHNVQVVGGCCGIGPAHIQALTSRLS